MKRIIRLLVLALSLFILTGCGTFFAAIGIPVYTGMSIVGIEPTERGEDLYNKPANVTVNNYNPKIDKMWENDSRHIIEKEIEYLIEFKEKEDNIEKYYLYSSREYTLRIDFKNPNNYPIHSFKIDDEVYDSNTFVQSDDKQFILIDMVASHYRGLKDLVVSDITYSDGDEIKLAYMDAVNKIQIGVPCREEIVAEVSNLNINVASIEFWYEIKDSKYIIGKNRVFVFVSDGEKIVNKVELSQPYGSALIDELPIFTRCQIAIVTAYDLCDGYGMQLHVLYKNTFHTYNSYGISIKNVASNTVTFALHKNGMICEIKKISIYDYETGELISKTKDVEQRSFLHLKSKHTYYIRVDFSYTEGVKSGSFYDVVTFTTN